MNLNVERAQDLNRITPAFGSRQRFKSFERKAMILEKATELFALYGYHGLTTRELAKALSITEPVLYQHFKSKEDLWLQVIEYAQLPFGDWSAFCESKHPSTAQFIFMTSLFVWGMTLGKAPGTTEDIPRYRHILQVLGHGLFETEGPLGLHKSQFDRHLYQVWWANYQACLDEGELTFSAIQPESLWVAFHHMLSRALFRQSLSFKRPPPHEVHSAEKTKQEKDQLILFTRTILLGLGLKESAIKTYFSYAKMYLRCQEIRERLNF
jgi:AcrR family transcriptional regulator